MDNNTRADFAILNPISEKEALSLHPMSLAFVGDAVQSLYTRSFVTIGSDTKTGMLHREVTKHVSAVAQAAASERIHPLLNETEADVFRRARNCHIQTSAKHAERGEYRKASGLEAVLGYLYLTGQNDRLKLFLDMTVGGEQ